MRTGRNAGIAERGFTLIELMVVIVILGGLVALVAPNVFKADADSTRQTVELQIHHFNQAIGMFRLENRSIPQSLEELVQPSKRNGERFLGEGRIPLDRWETPYEYRPTNAAKGEYTITSAGPDRQSGTADDIVYDSSNGFR